MSWSHRFIAPTPAAALAKLSSCAVDSQGHFPPEALASVAAAIEFLPWTPAKAILVDTQGHRYSGHTDSHASGVMKTDVSLVDLASEVPVE